MSLVSYFKNRPNQTNIINQYLVSLISIRQEKLYYRKLNELEALRKQAHKIYLSGGNRRDTKEIRRQIRKLEHIHYGYHYIFWIAIREISKIHNDLIQNIFYSMFTNFHRKENIYRGYSDYYWQSHFGDLTDDEFETFLVAIKNKLDKYAVLM